MTTAEPDGSANGGRPKRAAPQFEISPITYQEALGGVELDQLSAAVTAALTEGYFNVLPKPAFADFRTSKAIEADAKKRARGLSSVLLGGYVDNDPAAETPPGYEQFVVAPDTPADRIQAFPLSIIGLKAGDFCEHSPLSADNPSNRIATGAVYSWTRVVRQLADGAIQISVRSLQPGSDTHNKSATPDTNGFRTRTIILDSEGNLRRVDLVGKTDLEMIWDPVEDLRVLRDYAAMSERYTEVDVAMMTLDPERQMGLELPITAIKASEDKGSDRFANVRRVLENNVFYWDTDAGRLRDGVVGLALDLKDGVRVVVRKADDDGLEQILTVMETEAGVHSATFYERPEDLAESHEVADTERLRRQFKRNVTELVRGTDGELYWRSIEASFLVERGKGVVSGQLGKLVNGHGDIYRVFQEISKLPSDESQQFEILAAGHSAIDPEGNHAVPTTVFNDGKPTTSELALQQALLELYLDRPGGVDQVVSRARFNEVDAEKQAIYDKVRGEEETPDLSALVAAFKDRLTQEVQEVVPSTTAAPSEAPTPDTA